MHNSHLLGSNPDYSEFSEIHHKCINSLSIYPFRHLSGKFQDPARANYANTASQGNCYALTGVCMLTGFTWCIPIRSKKSPQSPHSIPPVKEGKPHGKKSQSIGQTKKRLNCTLLGSPSSKFMSKTLFFKSSFSVKSQQIMQISRISPTVPTNYAKFATKFIHISSMLSGS